MTKQHSLPELATKVFDGAIIAFGGNALHRSPAAFARELVRQEKKELELVKTAGAYDVDVLAAARALKAVHGGYIGFEMKGLAQNYRRGVESGEIEAKEHACSSVIAGLRAAAYGVPFQPIHGFNGSDLVRVRGWMTIENPYGEGEVVLIPKLEPDFAVIHVHMADPEGNAWINGPEFEDLLMIRAAKTVLLTAEKVIENGDWKGIRPQIPGFLVHGVAEVTQGAKPGSCFSCYPIDESALNNYLIDPKAYVETLKKEAVR